MQLQLQKLKIFLALKIDQLKLSLPLQLSKLKIFLHSQINRLKTLTPLYCKKSKAFIYSQFEKLKIFLSSKDRVFFIKSILYLIGAFLLLVFLSKLSCSTQETQTTKQSHREVYASSYKRCRVLQDINPLHLKAAKSLNNKPFTDENLMQRQAFIVKVSSCENYYLARMTASDPYLLTRAKKLLDDIAEDFAKEVKKKTGRTYKLRITSLLRTVEAQKRLTRRNVNAANISAHCYGTTFDISWVRYRECGRKGKALNPYKLRQILTKILISYKKNKRCYVIQEKRQACFHITLRP